MNKKFLATVSATVMALSMGMTAMADPITSDMDYGTAGQAGENTTGWASNINGQFAIEDGQSITFTFDSKSADTSNAVFGWVAEITDNTSYFTITQGGTAWFAPDGCDWQKNTNNTFAVEKNWEDAAVYGTAMADAKVELVVTRAENQVVFDSKATGADGQEYTQTITGVFETAPTGTLYIQLGVDHGSMVLYSAKYGEAGEVEEVTTPEKVTLKPNLDPNKGLSTTTDNTEDTSNSTTIIIVVVAVVLVIAIVVGVVVATKKKKN